MMFTFQKILPTSSTAMRFQLYHRCVVITTQQVRVLINNLSQVSTTTFDKKSPMSVVIATVGPSRIQGMREMRGRGERTLLRMLSQLGWVPGSPGSGFGHQQSASLTVKTCQLFYLAMVSLFSYKCMSFRLIRLLCSSRLQAVLLGKYKKNAGSFSGKYFTFYIDLRIYRTTPCLHLFW